jgi:pyruvate/2-oxoglutarate dehydrogenase complex dihydrolipoamide dehydrogenase (E3) component
VDGRRLTTRHIIIATGARPLIPDLPGLHEIDFLHTDNLWDSRKHPGRLLVLGGGPIGAELSQCFARLGIDVTLVESSEHLLQREDKDVSDILMQRLQKEGVRLMLGQRGVEVKQNGGQRHLVTQSKSGERNEIEFDTLLLALGRTPNVSGFGLEELGMELDERGAIRTNAYSQTSIPNIYACGDVTSPYQFTHMAAHQAWYCAVNALFKPIRFKVNLDLVPWCTYTDPEIARVGLNEQEAQARGIPYEVTRYGMDDLDRAIADEEDEGVVKILTVPGRDRILGATICSAHAGDLLPEYVSAMKFKHGLKDILGTIHMYPTMAEANKYAAGEWQKAHKPEGVLRFLKKYHAWRRG